MLKPMLSFAAAGLALATSLAAQSLGSKPVNFGIAGGMSAPTGDFGNAVKTGYNLSALLQFQAPLSPVSLRVEGQFQSFDAKNVAANAQTIAGIANLVYYVPSSSLVRPYLTGGLGLFHLKTTNTGTCVVDCSASENKLGFDLGGGLEFQLTGMSTFVEADWQSIQTDGGASRMIPIRFGIKF